MLSSPLGTIFLRSLFMIIVPLVAASLLVGVVNLGSGALLKKLGWKVTLFYITTTLCAIVIGQTLINTLEPGAGIPQTMAEEAIESSRGQVESLKEKSAWVGKSLWPGIVDKIIPKNILRQFGETNMLAIIFVSLLFGIALLGMAASPRKETFVGFPFCTVGYFHNSCGMDHEDCSLCSSRSNDQCCFQFWFDHYEKPGCLCSYRYWSFIAPILCRLWIYIKILLKNFSSGVLQKSPAYFLNCF